MQTSKKYSDNVKKFRLHSKSKTHAPKHSNYAQRTKSKDERREVKKGLGGGEVSGLVLKKIKS